MRINYNQITTKPLLRRLDIFELINENEFEEKCKIKKLKKVKFNSEKKSTK